MMHSYLETSSHCTLISSLDTAYMHYALLLSCGGGHLRHLAFDTRHIFLRDQKRDTPPPYKRARLRTNKIKKVYVKFFTADHPADISWYQRQITADG